MMDKDFPCNRFDFSSLIEYIEKSESLPDVVADPETGIEFYGVNTVSSDVLVCFLKKFYVIDNYVQSDSKQEYEKHTHLGVKNFQFEPSWVEITLNKVKVGYVGLYINTDFSLTFSKVNGVWTLDK